MGLLKRLKRRKNLKLKEAKERQARYEKTGSTFLIDYSELFKDW